jgi:hypothetical protein
MLDRAARWLVARSPAERIVVFQPPAACIGKKSENALKMIVA